MILTLLIIKNNRNKSNAKGDNIKSVDFTLYRLPRYRQTPNQPYTTVKAHADEDAGITLSSLVDFC